MTLFKSEKVLDLFSNLMLLTQHEVTPMLNL